MVYEIWGSMLAAMLFGLVVFGMAWYWKRRKGEDLVEEVKVLVAEVKMSIRLFITRILGR